MSNLATLSDSGPGEEVLLKFQLSREEDQRLKKIDEKLHMLHASREHDMEV